MTAFPVELDRFVFYEIIYFITPRDCAQVEAVCRLWREWIAQGDIWHVIRNNTSSIRHLAFKKISGVTEKKAVLRAWGFVEQSIRGFITIVGGSRDDPVPENATMTFLDRGSVFSHIIDDEELSSAFPGYLSAAAVALDSRGAVVTFGGWDGETAIDQCFRRETSASPWEEYHSLVLPACCYAAATSTVNGDIIVCGGGSSIFNGASVFRDSFLLRDEVTFSVDDWTKLPDMLESRCGHGCVTLMSGRSYAVGGYGGGALYHSSAEFFDPCRMAWYEVGSMIHPRSGLGVDMSPQGSIYAVAGSPDGMLGLDSVERFDEREGKWEQVSSLLQRRGYCGACFGGSGILYAAGGLMNDDCVPSIEWMDPRTHTWQILCNEANTLKPMNFLYRADFQMLWQPI